jgi:hypothetical protein
MTVFFHYEASSQNTVYIQKYSENLQKWNTVEIRENTADKTSVSINVRSFSSWRVQMGYEKVHDRSLVPSNSVILTTPLPPLPPLPPLSIAPTAIPWALVLGASLGTIFFSAAAFTLWRCLSKHTHNSIDLRTQQLLTYPYPSYPTDGRGQYTTYPYSSSQIDGGGQYTTNPYSSYLSSGSGQYTTYPNSYYPASGSGEYAT